MPDQPQSYAHHARYVPGFHFGVFGAVLINLLWSLWKLFHGVSGDSLVAVVLALGLVGLALYARTFATTLQDRVIRLEMRLRLERLLPEDLRGRIGELSVRQLIALRFAGDSELPSLVRQVLDGEVVGSHEIKKRIGHWQADTLRV